MTFHPKIFERFRNLKENIFWVCVNNDILNIDVVHAIEEEIDKTEELFYETGSNK